MFKFLKKLGKKEAQELEDCLAQNGMEFESQEAAEKFLFSQRNTDLEEVKQLNEHYPQLNLDYKAQSLKRLESFFYSAFVDKKVKLEGISKEHLENLMSQYMRQVFVFNDMAEWRVFENDFAEGRYDIGLMYGYGSGTMENYATGLSLNKENKSRTYLYDKFMMYVPADSENQVQ